MELSERKQKILQAIVDEYLGTAEPVGSRVLSKRNELGLSSATIRNEMADLEGMGFLVQPHTSAGRIPSDSGYRFYVNSLMQRYQLSVEAIEKMQSVLEERVLQLEHLIRKASLIASTLTEYTTIVSTPDTVQSVLKKLDLVHLGGGNVMLIVVTKEGIVKNQMLPVRLDEQTAVGLNEILNRRLAGLRADEISFRTIELMQTEIEQMLRLSPKVLISIMSFVYETIESLDETHFFVENAKSILQYPEYSSIDKAKRILNFLEDEKNLRQMMKTDGSGGVEIKIGTETGFEELSDCSLVTVDYSVNNKPVGKIGVIGPKRMDYAKVIANLDCISSHIDKILYQLYIGESEG